MNLNNKYSLFNILAFFHDINKNIDGFVKDAYVIQLLDNALTIVMSSFFWILFLNCNLRNIYGMLCAI